MVDKPRRVSRSLNGESILEGSGQAGSLSYRGATCERRFLTAWLRLRHELFHLGCCGWDKDSFVQVVSFLRPTSQQIITMSDPATKLCERAQAGDMEAASELVAQFYERLYAWFRRLTGHDQDAADLTQKTF